MTVFLIILSVFAYFTMFGLIGRAMVIANTNACPKSSHHRCEHEGYYIAGALWPLSLPVALGLYIANSKERKHQGNLGKLRREIELKELQLEEQRATSRILREMGIE